MWIIPHENRGGIRTIMDAAEKGKWKQFTEADNLAIICIALMALCSSWWVQLFNLAMIVLYAWAHRADWKADDEHAAH